MLLRQTNSNHEAVHDQATRTCIYHKSWMEYCWRCSSCDVVVAINVTSTEHEDDKIHRAIIGDDIFYKCEIGRIVRTRRVNRYRPLEPRGKKMRPRAALVGPEITSSKRPHHMDEDHEEDREGIRAETLLEGHGQIKQDATYETGWMLTWAKRLCEGWVKMT